jgi:hypothetical protein
MHTGHTAPSFKLLVLFLFLSLSSPVVVVQVGPVALMEAAAVVVALASLLLPVCCFLTVAPGPWPSCPLVMLWL